MQRLGQLCIVGVAVVGLFAPSVQARGVSSAALSLLPARSARLTGIVHLRSRVTPSQAFAQVWYYHRNLLVQPPQQAVRYARLKMPLFGQYLLQTRAGDKAQIRFHDGTRLDLNQLTDVVLRSPQLTYVRHGEVAQFQTPGTVHRVQTPTAVAGTFDPTFDVKVEVQHSLFTVLNGTVQVTGAGEGVMVKSNRQTTVSPHQPPTTPSQIDAQAAFAWTDQVPTPDLGQDVALDASGGYVIRASSQRRARHWRAQHVIDGILSRGWETALGHASDQTVTIGFSPSRLYRVFEVIIDPAATGGDPGTMDLKDFEIRVSSTGTANSDFTRVYTGACKKGDQLQIFKLSTPVLAKYVQLVAVNNYGNPRRTAVAEIEVVANVVGLAYPMGITVDDTGNMYIGDAGNDRIQIISPRGTPVGSWGVKGSGPGQFRMPGSVVRDSAGNIYVVDTNNVRIQKLSPQGRPLAQWGSYGEGPGQFRSIRDIALDRQGNIYVADADNNRIQKLSPRGKPLAQWGTLGSEPGQFRFPIGIALDRLGNIYVAEYGNSRIQKLSPQGRSLAMWGSFGSAPGQFEQPHGVAVDGNGNIYVADTGNRRVQKLSPQGLPLAVGPTLKQGRYLSLIRIALDKRGHVYVTDQSDSHILKLNSSLQLMQQFGVFGASPQVIAAPIGVAVDSRRNIYVIDPFNGRIQKRSPSGRILLAFGSRTFAGPHAGSRLGQFSYLAGIAVDRHDKIYVVDTGLHEIQVLSDRGPASVIKVAGLQAGIAVDKKGAVYVVDTSSIIKKLSPQGVLLATLGARGQLIGPQGLSVDTSGNVYVVDAGAHTVVEFSPHGKTLAVLGTSADLVSPRGVGVDRHGNVFVADPGTNRIVKLSPHSNASATFAQHIRVRDPEGIAVDDQGNVYVADAGNSRIVELSPQGAKLRIWQ